MSKIDLNTIKSTPHTFKNTTISQLMTTITKITHRKKKKWSTLAAQYRKRVSSHREQKKAPGQYEKRGFSPLKLTG